MKRLIYLKIGDPNPDNKKISKNDLRVLEEFARTLVFQSFKKNAKVLGFKIIKEYLDEASVLIEFPDDQTQAMYDALRELEIVELIDSMLPKE